MLVDDDEDDQEIFLSVIANVAPAVTCSLAANGYEALKSLAEYDILPDLIFLDLNMPLMDGKQFLREVKKDTRFKQIPVIVLTTSSDTATINATKALGAENFVTKPDKYSGWEEKLKELIQAP